MKFEKIYRETEENLRLALMSLWVPGEHPMRPAIEELFEREPLLAEPVFQSTFGWEPSHNEEWRTAINPKIWKNIEALRKAKAESEGKIFRPFVPFKHQAESWLSLKEGKSIVVTSGTGSGKTECFMYPVLSDLYEQGRNNAIEAIFLYPLNALMEDQKKRLNEYCKATNLRFAVFNGDTPEYPQDCGDDSPEVKSREEIRNGNRPEILLTNPSMLEYILVRQKDQNMLQESRGKLRWIVIDEAHSYSGSAAVELAFQIKRILDAFGQTADTVRFACTSATIGGKNGSASLAEYISTITGQSVDKINVIGGNRLVPALDKTQLKDSLKENLLPSLDRIISLRQKINSVPGMTLQQLWEWLIPNTAYDKSKICDALHLIDELCELKVNDNPILSLRGHFFMRSISGLYACANPICNKANKVLPVYGHLTTYKSLVCPDCGAPLLEIVQCKRCSSFVLMGTSDSSTHKIYPCDESDDSLDYFSLDDTDDEENADVLTLGASDKFFLLPYNKEKFYNPVAKAHYESLDINLCKDGAFLETNEHKQGTWVDVRKIESGQSRSYCPSCGRLAEGSRLNFKHFRIPISFINQAISPVFLQECAPEGMAWGKYIAFTDSRQGTAISAKGFNIGVERNQAHKNAVHELAQETATDPFANFDPNGLANLDEAIKAMLLNCVIPSQEGLSLYNFANTIFSEELFDHLTLSDISKNQSAYKASLVRGIIGRRPAYEKNGETMGFFELVFPNLKKCKLPEDLANIADERGLTIGNKDWQDFLKVAIDYNIRLNNHIQPLIDGESVFIRDAELGSPIAAADDTREKLKKWPLVKLAADGTPAERQPRLVVLLCAALGIKDYNDLKANVRTINKILIEAWNALIDKDNGVLTFVDANDSTGYNRPMYNGKYVGCYYLDLSPRENNKICRIQKAKNGWICPVTGQILTTTFCGYSPLIIGEINPKLYQKYFCQSSIELPLRPKDNNEVDYWLENDEKVKLMKASGLWSDRHKYTYKKSRAYIAAEHSAQQSKKLLKEYTKLFSRFNPAINVLHCSTTMEMGVDIGDIDIVIMDTVPPTAANYLQRVGRAGRMGQSKSVAFSLCNNTPVGQNAFANPMWALQTANHMIKVQPSQTIIQRHINSYFLREFICGNGMGIQATVSIDEFMNSTCDAFINYLDTISTNSVAEQHFHQVFGSDKQYTIGDTINLIHILKEKYSNVIKELEDALLKSQGDGKREKAIAIQLRKVKSIGLLNYLSENQFIPNANMPTGVVEFDFKDQKQADQLKKLGIEADRIKNKIENASPADEIALQRELKDIVKKIKRINSDTSASRDFYTALNEYAPEQTVVINEKNHVSAGVKLFGAYNEETQTRGIFHCTNCGHTEYKTNLSPANCPICNKPYCSIIDKQHSHYTLAYEPVGFSTDQSTNSSREEKTEKRFYEIRPVLLETDWSKHTKLNMCEMISSDANGRILFYNVGIGHGFAFCKRCGRAAIEHSASLRADSMPYNVRPGHNALWGGSCEANEQDIARHTVFTGYHPTCYTVLRFKETPTSDGYINDKQLVFSLGVILKRALALCEGIDDSEIGFDIKQEKNSWILFVYDTAKGGCGYSLRLKDPVKCQEVLEKALGLLNESTCKCHEEGGACAKCLIDRTNYRHANLLSKGKVLEWLNQQKQQIVSLPQSVLDKNTDAHIVYKNLKGILKESCTSIDVNKITLYASDSTVNYAISDWISGKTEMGKYIHRAIANGKDVDLVFEYHPEFHDSLTEKLPFINIKAKFPDCGVRLVKDMGELKSAILIEKGNEIVHYFTDQNNVLSISNDWGEECNRIFADHSAPVYQDEKAPQYTLSPSEIVREGLTGAYSFSVKNYFSKAIEPYVLKDGDSEYLHSILNGKHVKIKFSDMYVNSALASLMLVYLIKELKTIYGFVIDSVTLQLDSSKRKCNNPQFGDYSYINYNFENKDDADDYTDELFEKVLDITPSYSSEDADHHRWLRIETNDGKRVEIRPDHGISGGYKSYSRYMNLDYLDGSVTVNRGDEDILYYLVIKNMK